MDRAGYLGVSAAALLWAFGGTFARTMIDRGASPLEISEARAWIATIVLGAILIVRPRRRPQRERVPRTGVIAFGLSIAAANYSYYRAIQSLPVAVAIVVQYTAPALIVCWFALVRRRAPAASVRVALGLTLSGVALLAGLPRVVATGHIALSGLGLVSAAVSAVAFAAYIVVGESIQAGAAPVVTLFRGFAVASTFWLTVQLFRGIPHTLTTARFLPGIAVVAIVATIVPFLLFIWGLGRIDASRAGIVSTVEPLGAALLAYLWLHQSLGSLQILGALLVVSGVGVIQFERPESATMPAGPPD